MYRVFISTWLLLGSTAMGSIIDSQVFINEFHYDNAGRTRGSLSRWLRRPRRAICRPSR